MARWGALAAVVGLTAGALLLRAPEAAVARVERGAAVEAVYATATVEAAERAEVRARASGPLSELRVREGAPVHRGDLLARIDARALATDVLRGRADQDAAQKRNDAAPQLAMLAAQAQGMQAQIAQAKSDVERAESMASSGAQTAQQLERSRTQLSALQAQLDANQAQQRDVRIGLDADLARARAGLATLSARAADTEVRAPMDGTVLVRRVEEGETVVQNQPLFKIGNLSRLQLEAQVDEADVGQVHVGTAAVVRVPAFDRLRLRAHVIKVAPEADRERKTFEVDLALESPPEALRPGMTAEVNLLVQRHDGVLLAPAAAIRDGALWVLDGGRARARKVQIGIRDLARVEVSGEVREGDLALLSDKAVDEGTRLRPRVEPVPLPASAPTAQTGLTER